MQIFYKAFVNLQKKKKNTGERFTTWGAPLLIKETKQIQNTRKNKKIRLQ